MVDRAAAPTASAGAGINGRIASRVRALRSELGITLDALAAKSDVSRSMLSLVARGAERATWRDPESGYLRRNVSPASFGSPFQIVDVVLPPGARVAYDNGAHDVAIHQQVWVREGSVEVTVGATAHRLATDDCLAMRLDQPTTFRNRTRKPARYVVVIAAERPHRRR